MKLFKKQKGEEGVRRVFGFPCDSRIAQDIKSLSKELALPIYPTAEHALGLGTLQIVADLQDEDSKEALHNHLVEEHFLSPLFNVDNDYDRDTTIKMRRRQLKRWELDRIAHELVSIVDRENIPPSLLVDITKSLLKDARRRRGFDYRRRGGNSNEEHRDTRLG